MKGDKNMASYSIENDSIGGGGLGGLGFGGGGIGFLIIILLFFACFSGGGLFGGRCGEGHNHDRDFDEVRSRLVNPCGCVSNCQIDKDVVTSRDAGIIEQNKIYEKNLERKLIEKDMVIQEQKNQLFVSGMFAELQENLNAKFGCLEKEIERKPNAVPHFVKTVDSCVQPQLNCFDRFREFGGRDRGRDDDCGWC